MHRLPIALVVLLTAGAAQAEPSNLVRVRCTDSCNVTVDGKHGRRVSERHWEFKNIPPGSKRLEATGTLGRRWQVGYVPVPETGEIDVLVSDKRIVTSPSAGTGAPTPSQPAPSGAASPDAGQPAPAKLAKLAVLKLSSRTGVDQAVADLFTDALVAELRKHPGHAVISSSDVAAALGAEKQRQLLGCTDTSCLAELGGALGVEKLVHGSIGRVGNSLVVYLTLVDSKKATALATVSERLKSSSDEAFFDALPSMVSKLLK